MAFVSSLIEIGLYFAIFSGQLFRLSLGEISFPLVDIFLIIFTLHQLLTATRPPRNYHVLWFLIYIWTTFILFALFTPVPPIKPLFYLLRLSCLLSLVVYPPRLLQHRFLILALLANLLFGFIQYIFWPDFTYFKSLGWDDHLNRLISTYFDPTFTGIIYVFAVIYFFSKSKFLTAVFFIGLLLTYSRSSFLALYVSGLYYFFFQKKIVHFLMFTLILIFSISLLPRRGGEGNQLERTSSIRAKIINYREGLGLIKQHPWGIGYNFIPYYKQAFPGAHDSGGFDSSLLNILITTGILGSIFFVSGFYHFFRQQALIKRSMIIALVIHSLFANSLFYPPVWLLLILI